jgi:hypothetical protein
MMRVLPDGLRHDKRRVRVDAGEDPHSFLLRIDEAVLLLRVEGMRAHEAEAACFYGAGERLLHFMLRLPAGLVCR